jgi:hypothetical protein
MKYPEVMPRERREGKYVQELNDVQNLGAKICVERKSHDGSEEKHFLENGRTNPFRTLLLEPADQLINHKKIEDDTKYNRNLHDQKDGSAFPNKVDRNERIPKGYKACHSDNLPFLHPVLKDGCGRTEKKTWKGGIYMRMKQNGRTKECEQMASREERGRGGKAARQRTVDQNNDFKRNQILHYRH